MVFSGRCSLIFMFILYVQHVTAIYMLRRRINDLEVLPQFSNIKLLQNKTDSKSKKFHVTVKTYVREKNFFLKKETIIMTFVRRPMPFSWKIRVFK